MPPHLPPPQIASPDAHAHAFAIIRISTKTFMNPKDIFELAVFFDGLPGECEIVCRIEEVRIKFMRTRFLTVSRGAGMLAFKYKNSTFQNLFLPEGR
jgi:hypothetical protein